MEENLTNKDLLQNENDNNKEKTPKDNYMDLYRSLPYEYQSIVISTFKCLTNIDDEKTKGYKPFDIVGLIQSHQKELNLTDSEVCNKVTNLYWKDNPNSEKMLTEDTYRKIKQRNTQSSQSSTKWLDYIAKALEFKCEDYSKYLTDDGIEHMHYSLEKYSNTIYNINTLYDLLGSKERAALQQLTTSLLQLNHDLSTK